VTRATEQSAAFRELLEKRGANVLCFPAIEIADPDSWLACDNAIWKIANYDVFCFNSKNGAEKFIERLRIVRPQALEILSKKDIFAIGEKTAATLRSNGFSVHAVPHDTTAQHLAQMIKEQAAANAKILFPTSAACSDILPKNITQNNFWIDRVVVYKTVAPPADSDAMRPILDKTKVIDVSTFFSPSCVHNFIDLFGTDILKRTAIAVIGPSTAEAVKQSGLDAAIVAEQATKESLAIGIEKWKMQKY
jgi:uroporphyrinogen III methyltransferase/synthase